MIKNLINELTAYIEFCTYIDVCEKLKTENELKLKYGNNWLDKVDETIQKAISNNHDALYANVFNDCCDAFELDDEERKELMGYMRNDR